MDFSGDISAMVLKASIKGNLGEYSLDTHMLKVLMELDGRKNLATVARALNINMATLRKLLMSLDKLSLLEQVESATPMLDNAFYDVLRTQLSVAMGPIAEILIEDEVQDMGLEINRVPQYRAAELVDALARQIPREEKRVAFQQAMVKKLREISR